MVAGDLDLGVLQHLVELLRLRVGVGHAYDPGITREDEVVVVETLVFSVPQNKLLWAGVTETTNPKNATQVIKDVVAATVREMEKQGLVRRGSK